MEYDLDSELIIHEVEKYPNLYDTRHDSFKSRELKNEAWIDVAKNVIGKNWDQMDENEKSRLGAEVKKRWKSMKDSFLKSIKSDGERSSVTGKTKKRYVYHKQMNFLRAVYELRDVNTRELYLERLSKLGVNNPMLLPDDSSSQDKIRQDEPPSRPSPPALKPKTEVIDIDFDDNKPKVSARDDVYIVPDPAPQDPVESSPLVHLKRFITPEIDLGVDVTQTPDDSSRSNVSADTNCLPEQQQQPPVYKPSATQTDPKLIRKRTLTPMCSSVCAKKRKEDLGLNSVQTGTGLELVTRTCVGSELRAHTGSGGASEHPIETFFRSMALTVMSFPPHLAAETRLEVCRIVTQMEIRAYAEHSQCFGPQIVSTGPASPDEIP